jgi:hypothetical protein
MKMKEEILETLAELLWNTIINELSQNPVEIKTHHLKDDKGLWFSVKFDGSDILIDNAIHNSPPTDLHEKRKLRKTEFIGIYPYYQGWLNGSIPRNKIRNNSENTSYIFGIIKRFE